MGFQIRTATASDIPAIRKLIQDSVRGLQSRDYTPQQIEAALATVFTVDSRLIEDHTYFVAFAEDGTLAGCGGWSRRKTLYGGDHHLEAADLGLLDPATDAAKIRAIFVAPYYARQGLGSLLLQAAEQAAEAAGFQRFEMGSTLTGVSLYKLRGYLEVQRVSVPVGSGETIEGVRMEKGPTRASAASDAAEEDHGRR